MNVRMACPVRKYPLKQPPNHEPPIPRYTLRFPEDVKQICTVYIGAQSHAESTNLVTSIQKIRTWLAGLPADNQPYSYEPFVVEHGQDIKGCHVWTCYWTDKGACQKALSSLDLPGIHASIPSKDKEGTGLWCETFTTPIPRLETNYMGLDYMPGLARLEGTHGEGHKLTAYWGAARDRIPDAAIDLFPKEEDEVELRKPPSPDRVKGIGQHIKGTNPYNNLCHIRSGQFWENCDEVELEAYESKLKQTLLSGLSYLWENPYENGVIGLRFLRNLPKSTNGEMNGHGPEKRKETCGAGFFRNMSDLEHWAEKHMSHLKIWTGAISHSKRFGPDMGLRLFHEVSILKKGEASFEYVNCAPETGAIRYMQLEHVQAL